jgi:ABC-type enterochelin transport system substrate-binding protein
VDFLCLLEGLIFEFLEDLEGYAYFWQSLTKFLHHVFQIFGIVDNAGNFDHHRSEVKKMKQINQLNLNDQNLLQTWLSQGNESAFACRLHYLHDLLSYEPYFF